MAKFPIYNPVVEEAVSPPIGGMTNALALISETLNLGTTSVKNETMTELYISDEDRYRIYAVPVDKRGWLETPAPIIKKNGVVITPITDGFGINYMGGSVEFLSESSRPTESDIITADFTYVNGNSEVISDINTKISSLIGKTSNYRGSFDTLSALEGGVLNPLKYDYAFVFGTVSDIYFYDELDSKWVSVTANDVSELKAQIKALQDGKENKIATKGTAFNKDFGTENENVMRGDYAYSKNEIDTQLTAKENAIGNKGTAFNKDFGTVTGTVADGGDSRFTDARTPKSHADSSETYGVGDSDKYGHLKLSDSVSSSSDVTDGVSATPLAVKRTYDLASENSERINGKTTYIRTQRTLGDIIVEIQRIYATIADNSTAVAHVEGAGHGGALTMIINKTNSSYGSAFVFGYLLAPTYYTLLEGVWTKPTL